MEPEGSLPHSQEPATCDEVLTTPHRKKITMLQASDDNNNSNNNNNSLRFEEGTKHIISAVFSVKLLTS
jgi:hypothetical protein